MKEVFISYSSKNTKEANRIVNELQLMDISCWLAPRELIPSSNYGGVITEAIKSATFFVVLVSKDAQDSPQVLNELSLATHYRKEIIAYMLDQEQLNGDFEYYLRSRHWIDASTDRITTITKIAHLIREKRNAMTETPKSKEVLETERQVTEMTFLFVRFGVVILTVIIWLIAMFLLHSLAYGTRWYSWLMILFAALEIFAVIKIAGPIFGGSKKLGKKILKEIIEAFTGKNQN